MNENMATEIRQKLFDYFKQEYNISLMYGDFNEIDNCYALPVPDIEALARELDEITRRVSDEHSADFDWTWGQTQIEAFRRLCQAHPSLFTAGTIGAKDAQSLWDSLTEPTNEVLQGHDGIELGDWYLRRKSEIISALASLPATRMPSELDIVKAWNQFSGYKQILGGTLIMTFEQFKEAIKSLGGVK